MDNEAACLLPKFHSVPSGNTGGKRGNQFLFDLNPFDDQGNVLPHINTGPRGEC